MAAGYANYCFYGGINMWSATVVAAAFLVVRGLVDNALGEEISIRAPVGCVGVRPANRPVSCGADSTLSEAIRDQSTFKLMPFLDDDFCIGSLPWAPVDDMRNGRSTLNRLLALAKSGEIFGPSGNKRQIVEAIPVTPGELHLALCAISHQSGPPMSCVTVAIIADQKVWMRGKEIYDSSVVGGTCNAAAIARVSGAIQIEYMVTTEDNPLVFATSLRSVLTTKQGLSPELDPYTNSRGIIESVILTSSAPLRDSRTLQPGWREAFDFDVYFGRRGGSRNVLSVSGTLSALISRLAVGSVAEYRGLNDTERSSYAATFDALVGESIKLACRNSKVLDVRRIDCRN
jgi:hypothetical protein